VVRLAPWLHVIARRVALNMRRAQTARGECELLDVAGGLGDDGAPAAARARLHEVVAAVGALPPRQREAIVMRELEGRSYVEIAERLHSSPNAVRQLLHRARAGVRQRVTGVLASEPLVRWAAALGSAGSGSRVGALADSCAATAKLCAALVAVSAGGVSALEAGQPARPALTPHTRPMTTTQPAVAAVAHRSPLAVTRTASRSTTTTTPTPTAASGPTSTVTTHAGAPPITRYVAVTRATRPVVLVSRVAPTTLPTRARTTTGRPPGRAPPTTGTRSTDAPTRHSQPFQPSQPSGLDQSARQPTPTGAPTSDMPDSPARGQAQPIEHADTFAARTGRGNSPR
jgi:DNA-binding CsgD family transcriptional regulator